LIWDQIKREAAQCPRDRPPPSCSCTCGLLCLFAAGALHVPAVCSRGAACACCLLQRSSMCLLFAAHTPFVARLLPQCLPVTEMNMCMSMCVCNLCTERGLTLTYAHACAETHTHVRVCADRHVHMHTYAHMLVTQNLPVTPADL